MSENTQFYVKSFILDEPPVRLQLPHGHPNKPFVNYTLVSY